MRLPKKKGKKPHALGKEEYETLEQTLYRTFENKKSVAVLLALKTGIRLGELSALKWTDIDIEEGTIYIRNAVQRVKTFGKKTAKTEMVFDGTKTFSSSRAIPMNDEIREFLLKYAGQVKKNGGSLKEDFVFSNCDRSFIDPRVYQYYFSKLLKQTGIKQTNFHALRHTFATVAASKNMQISVLSRILGHSDISTTLRLYVHPLVEQDRIEMCKISKSYWSQSA
ncbi:MAG: site-specific integrase [Eubacterium sp.]